MKQNSNKNFIILINKAYNQSIKIRDRGDNGEAGEKLKAARASNLCLAPGL